MSETTQATSLNQRQSASIQQIASKENRVIMFKKMTKVMKQLDWIPKRGYNNFHNYNYVQEADVVNKMRDILADNGLVLLPPNVVGRTTFGNIALVDIEFSIGCADTGEIITGVISTEGMDKGDKKFPKAYASATKYFLMKTFLIPTGDDPEGDIRTDQQAEKRSQHTKKGPSKDQLENNINSMVMQLTQAHGYDGNYVFQLCVNEIGKEFNQLNELNQEDLQKISRLLDNQLKQAASK